MPSLLSPEPSAPISPIGRDPFPRVQASWLPLGPHPPALQCSHHRSAHSRGIAATCTLRKKKGFLASRGPPPSSGGSRRGTVRVPSHGSRTFFECDSTAGSINLSPVATGSFSPCHCPKPQLFFPPLGLTALFSRFGSSFSRFPGKGIVARVVSCPFIYKEKINPPEEWLTNKITCKVHN